jgi:hypothetical protein
MTTNPKNNTSPPIRALDQELIDRLYKELTNELELLLAELNDSSKMGAYGATATLSAKIADIASDLKKLQHLPSMLTNPFVMADPREILDEIYKKHLKNLKRKKKESK